MTPSFANKNETAGDAIEKRTQSQSDRQSLSLPLNPIPHWIDMIGKKKKKKWIKIEIPTNRIEVQS